MDDKIKSGSLEEDSDWWGREIDRHNDSQERLVVRSQDLLKLLLVLSGGALAVCASFFSGDIDQNQLQKLVFPIQGAWLLLTVSIVSFTFSLLFLLAYDSIFHENRLRYLNRIDPEPKDVSDWWHRLTWVFGLIGFVCFCSGMSAFCWAALGYIHPQ